VMLLIFTFAVDPNAEETRAIAGGLLWIVFAFAGALILNRSFARELPNDCLDALIASPIPPSALFLGKAIANFTLLVAVDLACLPVFGIFYNVGWMKVFWPLLLVLLLGNWGMTMIGTSFSALTVNIRLRELMLPLLVYPILMPALMGAIELTNTLLGGETLGGNLTWLKLMVGFDIIYTAISVMLIEVVLVG
ncbi:MAG: heme exporter protein CcmB, partial [Acidobacteriota bacterium]|nr:heme exporter protein CcmB [Acidobacteriota bacterium]